MAWITTPLCAGSIPANAYDYTISPLSASTVYEYRAYMVVSGTPYYGNILTGTTLAIPTTLPTIITSGITSITATGATGGGLVTSDGNSMVTARGVAYGLSANPTIAGTHTITGGTIGSFSTSITGLTPYTTYYVRAYATNAVGTGYGNQVSFITAAPALPTVSMATTTWTWTPTITANNVVTVSGGDVAITARGTIWSLNSNPQIPPSGSDKLTNYPPFTTGSFTATMSEAQLGLGNWWYRAYACTDIGVAYSTNIFN